MNEPEIHGMLALNTAHLTQNTYDLLREDRCDEVAAYRKDVTNGGMEIGLFVALFGAEYGQDISLPDDLRACVETALEHECDWIMFDPDIPLLEGLPSYPHEW